jgi:hypothetical protein|tara:strand:- start:2643 stop:3161 length:519 start_codon:yes stop_codon:yes gene_type:complete
MAKFKIYGFKDKYTLDETSPVGKTKSGLKGSLFGASVDGLKKLHKDFDKVTEALLHAYAAALFDESVRVMNASQKLVPVDSRDLKRSAIVKPPRTLKRPETSLSYNTPYALYQHEHHEGSVKNPGPRAKYLEGPMQESSKGLENRLVRGVKKHARKGTKVSSLKPKTYPRAR